MPSLTTQAMDPLRSYPWPGNMRELQRLMERFVSQLVSGEIVPDDKEFLEFALMEMLAELPHWESAACGDGGGITNKMRKPAEEIEQDCFLVALALARPGLSKKEANLEYLRFSPATP